MLFRSHGWWVIGGTKMSKSLGNVVKPLDLAQVYGVDAFRYFLMRDMTLGRDSDFTEENLLHRYQSDLANDLGNLLHRIVNMVARYCDGQIPAPGEPTADEISMQQRCAKLAPEVFSQVKALALNEALANVMSVVREINRYVEAAAPWSQAKASKTERVATILYSAAEALRLTSVLLQPVMPERVGELWRRLGWQAPARLQDGLDWGTLQPGARVTSGPPLFPREVEHSTASATA